jgi:hypothetical protein
VLLLEAVSVIVFDRPPGSAVGSARSLRTVLS